jgi:GGDEF domain-containing protein
VLTEVARVLRGHGNAGRLGGDEFAVWVPGDAEAAARVAARAVLEAADAALYQAKSDGRDRATVASR